MWRNYPGRGSVHLQDERLSGQTADDEEPRKSSSYRLCECACASPRRRQCTDESWLLVHYLSAFLSHMK